MKRTFFVALSATVLFANAASATPPAAPGQRRLFQGTPAAAPPYVILDLTVAQATAQIAKIATWDVTMQSTSCTDPDAGTDSGADASADGGIASPYSVLAPSFTLPAGTSSMPRDRKSVV